MTLGWRGISVALLVSLSLVSLPAAVSGETARTCEQAREWVDTYVVNHGQVPAASDLNLLPLPIIHEVVSRLSPEGRADFWREHLRFYLTDSLSKKQHAALVKAIDLLTSDLFERAAIGGSAAVIDDVKVIRATLLRGFTRPDVAVLVNIAQISGANLVPLPSSKLTISTEAEEDLVDCNCNTTDDWCVFGWICGISAPLCNWVSEGCGDFWLLDCDGQCCHFFGPGQKCTN